MRFTNKTVSKRLLYASLVLLSCTLFVLSCRTRQDSEIAGSGSTKLKPAETPPFATKEPERYQALRTITSSTSASTVTISKTIIARAGNKRYEEYQTTAGERLVYLETGSGKFLLLPSRKMFADLADVTTGRGLEPSSDEDVSPELFLHQMPLETSYELLGTESVGDRRANKYRVLTGSPNNGTSSKTETLIWIDERLGMPLRWETIGNKTGDQSRTTMELTGITLDVDERLFQLPTDYRRINKATMPSTTDSEPVRSKPKSK